MMRSRILALVALFALTGCDQLRNRPLPRQVGGGDPERGKLALQRYGCGGCHHVPGVEFANGWVAPPLDYWADRAFVAGTLSNNPESLIRWIRFPREVEPRTAMPDLGVTQDDAVDIAAYLYTLRLPTRETAGLEGQW